MYIQVLKSKIHRVRVTQANLNYVGSITIDRTLMEAVGILPGERVQVVDCNNGNRLDTYVIAGEPDSGVICLNGPAARLVQPDDIVIIMSTHSWTTTRRAPSSLRFSSPIATPIDYKPLITSPTCLKT